MSDLRIRYANQLAVSEFDLEDQVVLMKNQAAILKAILGTTTQLDGLECTPNSPADLNVIVGEGSIIILKNVLDTALGELPTQIPADTTHQIVKQAFTLDPTTIAITPPATPGFSRNDLIQIGFQEADGNPVSIPFFNGFTGQTINPPVFATKNTQRIDSVVIALKPGTPAATGTQVTPSPDVGYVGAWVVTTAQGQTTITAGNITEYPNAPFLTEKLKDKISEATADLRYGQITTIQSGGYLYAAAAGAANTYTASLTPAITAYTAGMVINIKINTANTGASTININSLGAKSIKLLGGLALLAGELATNMLAELYYDGTDFILLNPAKISIFAIVDGTQAVTVAGGNTKFTGGTAAYDTFGYWDNTNKKYVIKRAGNYSVIGHSQVEAGGAAFEANISYKLNGAQSSQFFSLESSGLEIATGCVFLQPLIVNDELEMFMQVAVNNCNFTATFQIKYEGTT